MDIGRVKLSKGRDFFGFRAGRQDFGDWIGLAPQGQRPPAAVILDLQRRERDVRALRVDGALTPLIPFPHAHQALIRSLTGPPGAGSHDGLEWLLPRRMFDQLADRQAAPRLKRLDLAAGIAADDTLLRHLGASLEHALAAPAPALAAAVEQITASLTVHLAQRYGGMRPVRSPQHAGLAAWQLRLASATFEEHLEGTVSLDDLASACGLSVSHFSRAFRRSTGLAPHRWLMQRRVEAAKDLMLAEPMPLAQVALACGFADQSHFTRTFANLIGLTPARWRTNQRREFALG